MSPFLELTASLFKMQAAWQNVIDTEVATENIVIQY